MHPMLRSDGKAGERLPRGALFLQGVPRPLAKSGRSVRDIGRMS